MSAHVLDRLSAYLDGEVPLADRAALEGHLRACSECARRLEELAAVDDMARSLPVEAPAGYFETFPARLRERLESRPAAAPWRLPVWTLAAAAVLVLAVVTPLTLKNRPLPEPARVAEAPAAQAVPPATQVAPPSRPAAGSVGLVDRERDDKLRSLGYAGEAAKQEKNKQDQPPAKKALPRQVPEERDGDQAAKSQQRRNLEEELQMGGESPADPSAAARAAPAAPPASASPTPAPVEPKPSFAQPPSAADETAPAGTAGGRLEGFESRESGAGKRAQAETKQKDESRSRLSAANAATGDARYQELLARHPRTTADARALRESWRAFARDHADDPRADEARVRAMEAGAAAWRLGADPADLAGVHEDASAYLKRADAAQAARVRAVLRDLER